MPVGLAYNLAGVLYTWESVPMNTKQAVLDILRKLPDDCTLDDLQYHLYVLQAIERGRGEIAAGSKLSHEEVKRELRAK